MFIIDFQVANNVKRSNRTWARETVDYQCKSNWSLLHSVANIYPKRLFPSFLLRIIFFSPYVDNCFVFGLFKLCSNTVNFVFFFLSLFFPYQTMHAQHNLVQPRYFLNIAQKSLLTYLFICIIGIHTLLSYIN